LELVVGSDISNASLGVQEVAVFQSKSDGATARYLAASDWATKDLIQTTGHLGASCDVGCLEREGARERTLASWRRRRKLSHCGGGTEGEESDCVLHLVWFEIG
jgi:hypothetical protein